jgi:hypothetical protein
MGCLFVLMAGFFPRFAMVIFWILRPVRVDAAFTSFVWPVLGIIFLPFATLMYTVLYEPGGLNGWEWFWVVIAGCLDVAHWVASSTQRSQVPGWPASRDVDLAP